MEAKKNKPKLSPWKKDRETRQLQRILNVEEIKPSTFTDILPAVISEFKKGKRDRLRQNEYDRLKIAINNFSIFLNNFISSEIAPTNDYFTKVLDLSDRIEINFKLIYDRIDAVKPPFQYLYWNYWNSNYNTDKHLTMNGEGIIQKYTSFFEQLKYEIALLKSKIIIK